MNKEASPSSSTSGNPDVELVPIFSSGNFAEVEIITDIFEEEDIAYMVRSRQMAAFWTTIGEHDQIRVYVEPDAIDRARKFIQQALVDEAIPGDGSFLEAEQREELEKVKPGVDKEQKKAEKEAAKKQKKAAKEQKKAAKKQKKTEKEAKKRQKQADREAKKSARDERKADKLDKQAEKLDSRADKTRKKADKQRERADKKREKADKKRDK